MISELERAVFERSALPLMLCSVVDGRTRAEVISDGFCRSFGLDREAMHDALRRGMYEYTHPDDQEWLHSNTEGFLNRRCDELDVVFRNRHSPDEDYTMVHMVTRWQTMADGSEYALCVYCDMAKTESAISRLFTQFGSGDDALIYTDPTTGLKNFNYNRQFSMDHVGRIRAAGGTPMFLVMDIQGMQGYNATYGYTNGDKLMRLIAGELEHACISPDAFVVRGADDDFFILDVFPGEEETLRKVREINEHIKANAYGVTNGIRVGACVMDEKARTTTAMDRARTALRELGDDLNAVCRFYSAEKDEMYWFRRYIVDSFEQALAEGWIKVFYQPILRTATRKMTALEALARWIDPSRGMIPPIDFIPLLSRFHQIYRLDLYMVEQICREFAVRREEDLPLLPVSVNFSAQDFDHVDVPAALDEILERYGVAHENIVVEITEQDIAAGTEHFCAQLRALRAHGYKLWIDDFGSGYSSLNVFSRFDVDRVKFDMDLLRRLDDKSGTNRVILKAITSACRELGVHTLAEGVETEEQLAFLRSIDCELCQGFLFSKPKPLQDAIFKRRRQGPATHYEDWQERRASCDAWLAKK